MDAINKKVNRMFQTTFKSIKKVLLRRIFYIFSRYLRIQFHNFMPLFILVPQNGAVDVVSTVNTDIFCLESITLCPDHQPITGISELVILVQVPGMSDVSEQD